MASVAAVVAGGAKMLQLQQEFERHLEGSRFFTNRDKVVVAVSTGIDSMVLLDLLVCLPVASRPQVIVAHFNHELRTQSKAEENFIRQYCQQHDLPLMVGKWPVNEHPQTGIENAARKVRYQFLAQVMKKNGAKVVLTAHHKNDLAETMLMKLVRGGQLAELIGLSPERSFANGRLIRPLLPFSKDQLIVYAKARHLKWYEDATNADLAIQRNRFRHQLIPQLTRENPQLLAHLADYQQQLTAVLSWQQAEVSGRLGPMVAKKGELDLSLLLSEDSYLQKLLVQRWLNDQGSYDLKETQLEEILALLKNAQKPQQIIPLPHHFYLEKAYQVARVKKANNHPEKLQKPQVHVIELEQWYQANYSAKLAMSQREGWFPAAAQVTPFWLSPGQFPLRIRPWQKGDRLRLKNGHHQQVKRVLINQKVPRDQRLHQLVLVDADDEVVWLIGRKWAWFDRPADYRQRWQQCFVGIIEKEKNE